MKVDDGAATLLIVALVAIVGTIAAAATSLGMLFVAGEQTATAAEAAALAAAVATYPPAAEVSPRSAAEEMAAANHAFVVSCACRIDVSVRPRTVTVIAGRQVSVPLFGEVDMRRAASAEFDPMAWLGG